MSGEPAAPRSPRAAALIEYLTRAAGPTYARLDAMDLSGALDVVDVTVEPELPQDRAVPIADAEPVRFRFDPADANPPAVRSLRADFPIDLVHTVGERGPDGLFLCVWEEGWADLARTLTPQALIERVRAWMTRSALGELHQAGQTLEPLMPATSSTLIIPAGPPLAAWHIVEMRDREGSWTVLLGPEGPARPNAPPRFPILHLTATPQVHGALRRRPYTLAELASSLEPMGVDLAAELGDWLASADQIAANERLAVILVSVPKQRVEGGPVEDWETLAFTPTPNIGELGELLGRTLRDGGRSVPRIAGAAGDLDNAALFGWRVVRRLDRAAARLFAGNAAQADARLVAVGAGAVGSNLIEGTTRAGIGTWTVVDADLVLPHNTVRQTQADAMIGLPKAETAARLADAALAEGGNAAIVADVLAPGAEVDRLDAAVAEADLLVDLSASPAVLGWCAGHPGTRRAASVFLGPDGSDLVVLAEDADRALRLDEIEAQYLHAVAGHPALIDHLLAARLDFIRYANACQDLSRPLPPWQVQTLCGVAAGQLLQILGDPGPRAAVWRLDPATGGSARTAIRLAPVERIAFADWRITLSRVALDHMAALRGRAAPDETGGILIGTFDAARRVVHIVDALPAPPDSRQSPTYFVRGYRKLRPLVDEIGRRSAGQLAYLGEWHSHPDGAAVRPSRDDEGVWSHIGEHIEPTGTPHVMAIRGARETWVRAGWQGRSTGEGAIDC